MEDNRKEVHEFTVRFFDDAPILQARLNREVLKRELQIDMMKQANILRQQVSDRFEAGREAGLVESEICDIVARLERQQAEMYPEIYRFTTHLQIMDFLDKCEQLQIEPPPELSSISFDELDAFIDQACDLILFYIEDLLSGLVVDAGVFGLIEAAARNEGSQGLKRVAVERLGETTQLVLNTIVTRPARHRPKNSAIVDDEVLLDVIEEVIGSFSTRSRKPTQLEVLHRLKMHPAARKRNQHETVITATGNAERKDTKTLRNWLAKCGLTWDEAIEKYWKPASGR